MSGAGERQVEKLKDYQTVFETDVGQRVLYDLMREGFLIRPTHTGNLEGPNIPARCEGRRELVIYIIEQLNRDEADIYKMIAENEERLKLDREGDYDEMD